MVGEGGHYLNRPGELRGGVLELIRAHRDRLEQCVPLEPIGSCQVLGPPRVGSKSRPERQTPQMMARAFDMQ